LKQILYFSIGAALGAVTAWYLTKRHYETFIDDEIEEVKERYRDEHQEENDRKTYQAKVRTLGYVEPVTVRNGSDNGEDYILKDDVEEELRVTNPFPGERADIPYTIGPDAYAEEYVGTFDKETITYWAGNDMLVTDADEILEINDTIGRENLEKIGEFEENTVFVRNERLGMDFEVVCMEGTYEPN